MLPLALAVLWGPAMAGAQTAEAASQRPPVAPGHGSTGMIASIEWTPGLTERSPSRNAARLGPTITAWLHDPLVLFALEVLRKQFQ